MSPIPSVRGRRWFRVAGSNATRGEHRDHPPVVECLEPRTLLTGYSFAPILRSSPNGVFPNYLGFTPPAVNNNGTVAFVAQTAVAPQDFRDVIFTGNGGPLTPIAGDGAVIYPGLALSSVNDSGTVAFSARFANGRDAGIYTGNGGAITPILEQIGATPSVFVDRGPLGVFINNNGEVAFGALRSDGEALIYTNVGGTLGVAVDSTGPFSGFSPGVINDSGRFAFGAQLDNGDYFIYTMSGGQVTGISTVDSSVHPGILPPALNNNGTAAFSGYVGGFVETGVLTGNGGALATYVNSSGPFEIFRTTSINDNGLVAFTARLDFTQEWGIFTGPDLTCNSVIRTGQTLDGHTVQALSMDTRSLNNAGQIAFTADFTDGSSGVYRADPSGANSAPTANAGPLGGNTYFVAQGDTVMLDASGSVDCEQPANTLTYEWDLDNDGQFDDATGMTPNFSAAALQASDTLTVGVRVTDANSLASSDTATIFVTAPAPGISGLAATSPIRAGTSTRLTGTVTGTALLSGKPKVTVDWGDRKTSTLKPTALTTALDMQHRYKKAGTFTVTVNLAYKKTVIDSEQVTVTVQPATVLSITEERRERREQAAIDSVLDELF